MKRLLFLLCFYSNIVSRDSGIHNSAKLGTEGAELGAGLEGEGDGRCRKGLR